MPGIEVKEGHEEVETNSGTGRNDKVSEDVVAKDEGGVWAFELRDDYVQRGEGSIGHDD